MMKVTLGSEIIVLIFNCISKVNSSVEIICDGIYIHSLPFNLIYLRWRTYERERKKGGNVP